MLRYWGSMAAYLLACFSKESGLVLLGILVIYEGFVFDRSAGAWGRRALRLVPFFLIALFYLGCRGRVLGGQIVGSQWWGGSPGKNFLMTFEVYAWYLRLLFYPLKLSPASRIPVPEGFWDARVLLGCALLVMSLGGMIWTLRRKPEAGFLASWFLIGLLPVANFIPIPGAMVAERWLYLPSVGACALGGWGAVVLYRRANGWVRMGWAGFFLLVLIFLGIRTWLWNPAWRDGVSMARAVLAVDPSNSWWHYYLGGSLRFQGQYQEAEEELYEAIRLNPAFVEAHYNLGSLFLEQGMLEKAAAEYREAIRLSPDFLEALENLAFTLDGLSRRKGAREFWLRAEKLESRPEWLERIKKRLAELD